MNTAVGTAVNEGETKPCPRCGGTLVFTSRHPILTVGIRLEREGAERGNRIRYERAWVCHSGRCDFRELLKEA